ncbi:MAG: hypothetical protein COZ21_04535 [Bacteroidetes bacterium CG_4_10_14_3_um_filter_31_20]|nr:MAG: hypothetical protein COZ21_04535 [Bacteroidetes bacterium CG_4_10_14_3_um_filter_31_20]
MITEEERNTLIEYRLQQAKETIEEADILIAKNKYRAAVNRIYYGMFYSLLALALKYKYESSKHQQLLGWFNKNFIHTKKIEIKYNKIIYTAFNKRNISDYDTFIEFTETDILSMFYDMKDFIAAIENFINSEK